MEKKTIKLAGEEVHIAQSVSTSDKVDFVEAVLSKSMEDSCYNPVLLDAYFHLNLVYLFSDIVFSDEDRADELALVDSLKNSGVMMEVISNIPEAAYKELFDFVKEAAEKKELFYRSATYNLSQILTTLPETLKLIIKEANNFDIDKYVNVKRMAEAANGNRDIETNLPIDEK